MTNTVSLLVEADPPLYYLFQSVSPAVVVNSAEDTLSCVFDCSAVGPDKLCKGRLIISMLEYIELSVYTYCIYCACCVLNTLLLFFLLFFIHFCVLCSLGD